MKQKPPKPPKKHKWTKDDLWDADPKCDHNIVSAPGGGIRCTKCKGWFCY